MKQRAWLILAVALPSLGTAFAAGTTIKPGLWEIHNKVAMHGAPYTPSSQTVKKCITAQEAKHFWHDLSNNKDKHCRLSDVNISGDRASWRMQCTGVGGQMHGKALAVIDNPTHYHASSDMTSTSGGATMKIHVETQGHRLGPCK